MLTLWVSSRDELMSEAMNEAVALDRDQRLGRLRSDLADAGGEAAHIHRADLDARLVQLVDDLVQALALEQHIDLASLASSGRARMRGDADQRRDDAQEHAE